MGWIQLKRKVDLTRKPRKEGKDRNDWDTQSSSWGAQPIWFEFLLLKTPAVWGKGKRRKLFIRLTTLSKAERRWYSNQSTYIALKYYNSGCYPISCSHDRNEKWQIFKVHRTNTRNTSSPSRVPTNVQKVGSKWYLPESWISPYLLYRSSVVQETYPVLRRRSLTTSFLWHS